LIAFFALFGTVIQLLTFFDKNRKPKIYSWSNLKKIRLSLKRILPLQRFNFEKL